jgi:hypothetical protein
VQRVGLHGALSTRSNKEEALRAPWLGQRLHLTLVAFVLCDVLYVHAALAQLSVNGILVMLATAAATWLGQ